MSREPARTRFATAGEIGAATSEIVEAASTSMSSGEAIALATTP